MAFPRNSSLLEVSAHRGRVSLVVGAGALLALLLLINQAIPSLPHDGEVDEVRNFDQPPRLVAERRSWEPVAFFSGGHSPTVALIVGGSFESQHVRICDACSGKTLAALRPKDHSKLSSPVVSPDGQYIAAWGSNHTGKEVSRVIHVWEVATAKEVCTLPGRTMPLCTPVFSPDSRSLASVLFPPRPPLPVAPVENDLICLWEIPSGKQLRTIQVPPDGARDLAFTPDGRRIVAPGNKKGAGSAIRTWDVATGKLLQTLTDERYYYGGIVLRPPDGKLTAVGCADMALRAICLWDLEKGQLLATLRDVDVASNFNKNGRWLATYNCNSEYHKVSIWDMSQRKVLHKLPVKGRLLSAKFSPDGRWLAATSCNDEGYFLSLWDMYPE